MQSYKQIILKLLTPALALAGMASFAAPASAQVYNQGYPGVANVSVANGSVVIIRGDSGAQVAAQVNAPLVTGDYIATSPGSNAEVQFDGVSMLRLASNTQVRFVNLSPGSREMQVASGTVDLAELQGADGSPQLDTPSLTVRPNQTGDYRVSVLNGGQTLVTVRSGAATVTTGYGSRSIAPGSTLVAYGPYSNPSITMQSPIGFDSFDQFNISRDQAVVAAYNSNPYLSPQLAGYSNLSNYGQWQDVPGYGYAWAPNNQAQNNFAPYQNGQWVWEPGYGYTWVDNAPYGYTTSHYGTWFNNPSYGGWLWQPPAYQYQNSSNALSSSWLPAVVSFFLSGSNGGGIQNLLGGGLSSFLGNSNANIGWIPLAPGEQYQPWYGQNYAYPSTGLSNVTNVTNVYNYYGNARYYGGATMMPVSMWRSGNFRRLVRVRPQQLRQIVLIRGAVPVVPTTSNLHYSTVAVRHPVVLSKTFVAPRFAAKAPVLTHASFTAEQSRIKAIAVAKPKVAPLEKRAAVVRPVYHPVAHPPVHLVEIKPVNHVAAHPAHAVKPEVHKAPAPKPVVHTAPQPKPMLHTAPPPKPMVHKTAAPKPMVHKTAAPKPMVHTAPPPKPMVHTAPPPKPMVHKTAAPKPMVHTAPPPKPMVHKTAAPKPMVHTAPPPKPIVHAAPPPKPMVHTAPPPKPVHPEQHAKAASAKPAATTHPSKP